MIIPSDLNPSISILNKTQWQAVIVLRGALLALHLYLLYFSRP